MLMKERKKELREHYKEDEEGKLRGEHVVVIFPPLIYTIYVSAPVLCLYCVSACLCISEEEYTTLRVARTCLSASDAKRQNKKFRDGFEE